MKNRDIVNHGASGKGDANRSPMNEAWRDNYDAIEWADSIVRGTKDRYGVKDEAIGFIRRGGKLIKKY